MKKKIISLLAFTISIVFLANCNGGGGSNPNAGFRILTYAVSPINTSTIVPTAGNVQGLLLSTGSNPTGTVTSFNENHSGVGYLVITGAKVPGTWRMALGPSPSVPGSLCLTYSIVDEGVSLNSEERLYCPGRFFGFTAAPDLIDVQNPPATVTLSGEGVDDTYGTPVVAFYDSLGNVAASATVSQVNRGKHGSTGVTVNVPSLNLAYDGYYTVAVHNIMSDGSWDVVGATNMTVYGNPPPPPGGGGDEGGCNQQPPGDQLPCLEEQNQ